MTLMLPASGKEGHRTGLGEQALMLTTLSPRHSELTLDHKSVCMLVQIEFCKPGIRIKELACAQWQATLPSTSSHCVHSGITLMPLLLSPVAGPSARQASSTSASQSAAGKLLHNGWPFQHATAPSTGRDPEQLTMSSWSTRHCTPEKVAEGTASRIYYLAQQPQQEAHNARLIKSDTCLMTPPFGSSIISRHSADTCTAD